MKTHIWKRIFYTPLEFCVTHSEEKFEPIFSLTQNSCTLRFYTNYCSKDRTLLKRSRTRVQKNFTIALKKWEWIRPIGETTIKKRTMLSTARWCGSDSDVSMHVLNQMENILVY